MVKKSKHNRKIIIAVLILIKPKKRKRSYIFLLFIIRSYNFRTNNFFFAEPSYDEKCVVKLKYEFLEK
jgi:hypothetical protein